MGQFSIGDPGQFCIGANTGLYDEFPDFYDQLSRTLAVSQNTFSPTHTSPAYPGAQRRMQMQKGKPLGEYSFKSTSNRVREDGKLEINFEAP